MCVCVVHLVCVSRLPFARNVDQTFFGEPHEYLLNIKKRKRGCLPTREAGKGLFSLLQLPAGRRKVLTGLDPALPWQGENHSDTTQPSATNWSAH